MTSQQAHATLAALRARQDVRRRVRYPRSKLARFRADLVALRAVGASYRQLQFWLRHWHRVEVDHSTIRRYLAQLPERQVSDHGEFSQHP